MKKTAILTVITVTLLLTSLSVTGAITKQKNITQTTEKKHSLVTYNDGPELTLQFDGTCVDITNQGDEPAENVEWKTWMQGLIFLGSGPYGGTIPQIDPGETKTVCFPGLVFGIGPVQLHFQVFAENHEKVSISKPGFILGSFLLGFN